MLKHTNITTGILGLLLLGGCATPPDPRLSLPYSEKVGVIHSYEAGNFMPVDKGEEDIMLFSKSVSQDILDQYRTFDTRAVSQQQVVYQSINKRKAASRMRRYVRQKLKQFQYKHVGRSLSQAGIAIAVSSYQKILGKNIEELMLVVFDRKKLRTLAKQNKELKGYALIKEAAVWVGVVRRRPEKQIDLSTGVHYMSQESFQKMVDMVFEVFMKDSQLVPLS